MINPEPVSETIPWQVVTDVGSYCRNGLTENSRRVKVMNSEVATILRTCLYTSKNVTKKEIDQKGTVNEWAKGESGILINLINQGDILG